MSIIKEDDIEIIKNRLKKCKEDKIIFNEPHFSNQMILREGNRKEVIKNILHPEKLTYVYHEEGKYCDVIYCLHFKISNKRTLKLPVIFNKDNKKILYIITYIMRYSPWQRMVKKKQRRKRW